ncbi:MAG: hypothetical protein GXP41_01420 [Chloroflexi bacterium]|nr:hypothetical protein [Chloroflexota bacterium]
MTLSYRQRVAFVGGIVGAFVGVMAALAYHDQLESGKSDKATELRLSDAIKLGASTVALLRQISELAH